VGGQTMSTYFIKCVVCNKDIITQHHNTRYCPDCKKKHEKKQQIAAHKKYEEKAKQEYEENIIRIRNSNARISAIAAEARKAGLTYGKYVASLREVTQ
jgi:predicted DNA binding CopG/RHH family protein